MSNFVIVPDSSADMTAELRKRFGIEHYVRGVLYPPDGSEVLVDTDWTLMTPEQYYTSMQGRKAPYKTATPPISEIKGVFEPILQSDKDILSISLSSGISGTYQVVQGVANELLEQYPDRKIICIDSLKYASAIALLVTLACEKRDAGATLEETAQYLDTIKYSIHQMGALDDLFFCVKTGRLTNFQAFFGTLIGVHSLGELSNKGLPTVMGKVKGKKMALEATIQYMAKTIKNPEDQIIFVAHSIREESANLLAERIRKEFNPKDVIINPIGLSCGSSIGPGMCAAYYIGSPTTDGEVEERKIMESILKK